jgi:dipeptidyl aminopeptidase/acylaminoacyl peptidase
LPEVSTPLLLAAGDDDASVLDAIRMYSGLRYLGKPVTLLRYPGEKHVLSVEAMKDFWPREMAFFAKYLSPKSIPSHISIANSISN